MQAFSSMFSQILKLFPRYEFQTLVTKHRAERHARGFTCWQQFVSMLFCQLGRAQSLREICDGLASTSGKLKHLGIAAPSRSTLAYANKHRPWELFQAVFFNLRDRCQLHAPKHRFRFKNRLLSLDASVIDLCADLFDWAKYKRTKGAVKLHLLLDHNGLLPEFAVVTPGKVADIQVGRQMRFPSGAIIVFDRGYNDFAWFERLTRDEVFFVTRLKRRTRYAILEERRPKGKGVLRDETIILDRDLERPDAIYYRRVVFQPPDREEPFEFITNNFDLAPATIAAIYKDRWQVELLFKALKQNLRIKTFVGTSANALHIQIWSALIAMLILKYLQMKSRYGWSLSNLIALLRFNLFSHHDLWSWLNDPFPVPSPPELAAQLPLPEFG
jgi:hypothetical protein